MPPSHLKFQSWIQDGGRGTHVTQFVQLYPQPLYTASQVRTTSRSWDKVVLTDLCLTLYKKHKWIIEQNTSTVNFIISTHFMGKF